MLATDVGTDYRVSLVPFGGYVTLQGESLAEAVTGDPREFRTRPRWQQLIVDAAVIGGRDRWARRLDGLERAARIELEGLEDREDAKARALERRIGDLAALRRFALPLIDALASLPARASWGAWLDALGALATRALRDPRRVLAALGSLTPMADVGPIASCRDEPNSAYNKPPTR